MLQTFTHYFLHFIAIGLIAWCYDKNTWKRNWLILLATMVVDLDHLFATPIFEPNRCGIGFHPLHSKWAILVFTLGVIFIKNKVLKLVFIGLIFHIITDFIDCLWMFSKCEECYLSSEIYKWLH